MSNDGLYIFTDVYIILCGRCTFTTKPILIKLTGWPI